MALKRQRIRSFIILSSFFLFPATFYYLSPYLIIDATMQGIVSGSMLVFSGLFLSSWFLGRGFCGWVCPAGGAQDTLLPCNPRRIKSGNYLKWVIWIPWIITIALLAIRQGGYSRIDPWYQTAYGFSIGSVYALITYLLVLALIVIPAFTVGKRSFCHHLCWMAPFMILGRKLRNSVQWSSLQLVANPASCVHCHTCSANCPMSLEVESMVQTRQMENSECILCATCADHCKTQAIKMSFQGKRNI